MKKRAQVSVSGGVEQTQRRSGPLGLTAGCHLEDFLL